MQALVAHDLKPRVHGTEVSDACMGRHNSVEMLSARAEASLLHLVEPSSRSISIARLGRGLDKHQEGDVVRQNASLLHGTQPPLCKLVLATLRTKLEERIVRAC